jgi:hypothetical protein
MLFNNYCSLFARFDDDPFFSTGFGGGFGGGFGSHSFGGPGLGGSFFSSSFGNGGSSL